MKLGAKRLPIVMILAGIALSVFPGRAWSTTDSPPDNAQGIRQCSDKLSDFHIHEKVGSGVATRVSNALTNKISSLLEIASDGRFAHDQGLVKTFLEGRADFDLLQETIDRNVQKGDWVLDQKSDQILDDCYIALHPNEPHP